MIELYVAVKVTHRIEHQIKCRLFSRTASRRVVQFQQIYPLCQLLLHVFLTIAAEAEAVTVQKNIHEFNKTASSRQQLESKTCLT